MIYSDSPKQTESGLGFQAGEHKSNIEFALGQTIRAQKKNLSWAGSIDRNLIGDSWERNRVTQDAAFHRSAQV